MSGLTIVDLIVRDVERSQVQPRNEHDFYMLITEAELREIVRRNVRETFGEERDAYAEGLAEALRAIIANRDKSCFYKPEEYVTGGAYGDYWSPHATMIDSSVIAQGRVALAASPTKKHCMCPACRDGTLHWSDCAVHNMPATPNGPCDCGAKP